MSFGQIMTIINDGETTDDSETPSRPTNTYWLKAMMTRTEAVISRGNSSFSAALPQLLSPR